MSANSSTPQQVDLLIHARWLIPVTEPGLVLESHSVAIKDQRIVAVRESQQARAEFHA
ncbi:MAG: hypothetical protein ACE37N_03255 [Pseudohongiellaceae bacterium]